MPIVVGTTDGHAAGTVEDVVEDVVDEIVDAAVAAVAAATVANGGAFAFGWPDEHEVASTDNITSS